MAEFGSRGRGRCVPLTGSSTLAVPSSCVTVFLMSNTTSGEIGEEWQFLASFRDVVGIDLFSGTQWLHVLQTIVNSTFTDHFILSSRLHVPTPKILNVKEACDILFYGTAETFVP